MRHEGRRATLAQLAMLSALRNGSDMSPFSWVANDFDCSGGLVDVHNIAARRFRRCDDNAIRPPLLLALPTRATLDRVTTRSQVLFAARMQTCRAASVTSVSRHCWPSRSPTAPGNRSIRPARRSATLAFAINPHACALWPQMCARTTFLSSVCDASQCAPMPSERSTAAVSIPAGGSILVYHAAYFSDDTGPFDMFVKTTSLL